MGSGDSRVNNNNMLSHIKNMGSWVLKSTTTQHFLEWIQIKINSHYCCWFESNESKHIYRYNIYLYIQIYIVYTNSTLSEPNAYIFFSLTLILHFQKKNFYYFSFCNMLFFLPCGHKVIFHYPKFYSFSLILLTTWKARGYVCVSSQHCTEEV